MKDPWMVFAWAPLVMGLAVPSTPATAADEFVARHAPARSIHPGPAEVMGPCGGTVGPRGGPRGPVVVREIGGWSSAVRSLRITGESVTEMTPGTTTIRHFGLRGEKLDIRFRTPIDSRGAFGKARAKYGILKAGIGPEGQERDLWAARRVPGW